MVLEWFTDDVERLCEPLHLLPDVLADGRMAGRADDARHQDVRERLVEALAVAQPDERVQPVFGHFERPMRQLDGRAYRYGQRVRELDGARNTRTQSARGSAASARTASSRCTITIATVSRNRLAIGGCCGCTRSHGRTDMLHCGRTDIAGVK